MKKLFILLPILCIFLACEKEEITIESNYITPDFFEDDNSYDLTKRNIRRNYSGIYECKINERRDIVWDYQCSNNSFPSVTIVPVTDILEDYLDCRLLRAATIDCPPVLVNWNGNLVSTVSQNDDIRPYSTNFGALNFADKDNLTDSEIKTVADELIRRGDLFARNSQKINGGNWYLTNIHVYYTEWADCVTNQIQANNCQTPQTFIACGNPSTPSYLHACLFPSVCEARGIVARYDISNYSCPLPQRPNY